MKTLIIHAHHEPKSFCSALSQRAAEALAGAGHEVVVSDLHAMGFQPVSDRRNFTTTADADYLKQQREETHATEHGGFAPDVLAEIEKLEACDLLVLSFPLWWFGMPAILKGWCDRVLAMGRVYGGGKLYETGAGGGRKRAMLITTTGGGPQAYDGWGVNPPMDHIASMIQHGIFWFNGFRPLEPFIAWSPARIGDDARKEYLDQLAERMVVAFDETPIEMPRLEHHPNFGHDTQQRFMVVARRSKPVDERYFQLIADEQAALAEWRRRGLLHDFQAADPRPADDGADNWRAFLKLRAENREEVERNLATLPLAEYLAFEITELAPLAAP
ncbi:MAG: NAD(P)H-dependent oxidoreductase [Planctomycetota bacterium]